MFSPNVVVRQWGRGRWVRRWGRWFSVCPRDIFIIMVFVYEIWLSLRIKSFA
jgi:hypothetical protein